MDHARVFRARKIGIRLRCAVKHRIVRGGYAILSHQVLGEALAALDGGRGLALKSLVIAQP